MRRVLPLAGLVLGLVAPVAAQPLAIASSSSVVVPGQAVDVTVTGPPGQHVALIGSSVGSGFSYGGVPLAVGTDVVILGTGVLAGGQASFRVTPPFRGATLDRYYLQAATSTNPANCS